MVCDRVKSALQTSGLLVAASAAGPVSLLANRAELRPDLGRIAAVTAGQLVLALVLAAALKRLMSPRTATIWVAAMLLFGTQGGVVSKSVPALVVPTAVASAIGAFLLGRWARRDAFWEWLMATSWIAVVIATAAALFSQPPPVAAGVGPILEPASGRPSFYLIVLDAYPSRLSPVPEVASVVADFASGLTDRGLQVVGDAKANYNFTYAALATALSLDHDLDAATAEAYRFFDRIKGDNSAVELLKGTGYRYVHVESGWSGSSCGPAVDLCRPGQFLDSTVEGLIDQSIFAVGFHDSSFNRGALQALNQLAEHARTDRGGDFVFAHVMLPHPPLQLNRQCARFFHPGLDSLTLKGPEVAPGLEALYESAFVEQTECLNQKLLELIDLIDPQASLVVTGDHGTDFGGQLFKLPAQWTRAEIVERFSLFYATRISLDCLPGPSDLVNLIRATVSCLVGESLQPVPPHHEIVPYYDFRYMGTRVLTDEEMDF